MKGLDRFSRLFHIDDEHQVLIFFDKYPSETPMYVVVVQTSYRETRTVTQLMVPNVTLAKKIVDLYTAEDAEKFFEKAKAEEEECPLEPGEDSYSDSGYIPIAQVTKLTYDEFCDFLETQDHVMLGELRKALDEVGAEDQIKVLDIHVDKLKEVGKWGEIS